MSWFCVLPFWKFEIWTTAIPLAFLDICSRSLLMLSNTESFEMWMTTKDFMFLKFFFITTFWSLNTDKNLLERARFDGYFIWVITTVHQIWRVSQKENGGADLNFKGFVGPRRYGHQKEKVNDHIYINLEETRYGLVGSSSSLSNADRRPVIVTASNYWMPFYLTTPAKAALQQKRWYRHPF